MGDSAESAPELMTVPSSPQVTCVGHIIGAVVADTQLHAQRAAKAVRIQYEELQPIVTIQVRTLPLAMCCPNRRVVLNGISLPFFKIRACRSAVLTYFCCSFSDGDSSHVSAAFAV